MALNDRVKAYWNSEEEERGKDVSVTARAALESSKLADAYDHFTRLVSLTGGIEPNAKVLSIACGSCWLEARAFCDFDFHHLTGLDYSKHRITKLAPVVLKNYGIDQYQFDLIPSDLFEYDFQGSKFDVIILNQAFHHFEDPQALLDVISSVAMPDGLIFITGEHYFSPTRRLFTLFKYYLKYSINYRGRRPTMPLFPKYQDLFPSCPVKGDNHYPDNLYEYYAESIGRKAERLVCPELGIKSFAFVPAG